MSIAMDARCIEVEESIADVLEGVASARLVEHIAECDRCRDFKYEAEQTALAMESVGADFHPTEGFAERMLGLVLEARPDGPQPSLSTSSIQPRTSSLLDAPTSGAQPKSSPDSVGDAIASAKTEFAPMSDMPVDTNATILEPTRTDEDPAAHRTLVTPPAPPQATIEGSPIEDPFVPTHKTMPLSALDLRAGTTKRGADLVTPVPVERDPDRIVEATTGRNNTGPGTNLDTSRPSGAAPAGKTLRAEDDRPVRIEPARATASSTGVKKSDGQVVSLFRRKGFIAALVGGMAAAAAVGGFLIKGKEGPLPPQAAAPDGAWSGTVLNVARASSDGQSGFEVCKDGCKPALAGAAFEPGSTLKTDSKTRVKVKLSDETTIALDRNSELTLPSGDLRVAKLERGLMVADIQHIEGGKPAQIALPQGEVKILGTKVACTVTDRRASIEVVRGEVDVTSKSGVSAKVRAGEEATLGDFGEPVVAAKSTMSDVLEWSSESPDDVDAPTLRGVGELRAMKPGEKNERAGAVRLTKHSVKVRVVDVVARTEVEEVFTNTTDEELEGIFRFPLPPGAQIEKLSLEVDGKLLDGAFVERERGAAIWRGVQQNAAPKAQRPKEEIVWVPGPWRDPALLEWQRGGRFELRIFPIPKKGSRRVVLTYTQTVNQSSGTRRFTYPLAHDSSGSTKIDQFDLDVQVLGHDGAFGLETRGYQLAKADATAGAERFVLSEKNFVPAGDLTVEYALPTRSKELTAWAYDMPAGALTATNTTPPTTNAAPPVNGAKVDPTKAAADEAKKIAADDSAYVALAIRPKLPRFPEGKERLHVLVVDSSRSMVGERFARATRLAASIVREMDRRDQFMVLACDVTCQAMGASEGRSLPLPAEPSAEAAQQVESFLGSIEPDGGSNLLAAMQAARMVAGTLSGRELRILYLGDGTPTVGPTKPATVEAGIRHILPSGDGSVVAVALGADADTTSLAALARGGNGVVVPYVPGQRVGAAAVDVLASAYGSVLSDIEVVLPAGLVEQTPKRIDPIPAGGEAFIFARMPRGKTVEGLVTVRGRVGNERFEQSYPANIVASSSAGNAFVPRLLASTKINELEQAGLADDQPRIIALSKQFNVASRHTSLLVLESEAMFKAFGLEKNGITTVFTGETGASSSSSDAEGEEAQIEEEKGATGAGEASAADDKSPGKAKKEALADEPNLGFGGGAGAGPGRTTTPAPAASAAPPPAPTAKPSQQARPTDSEDPFSPDWGRDRRQPASRPRPNMVPMRKVFDRKASFSNDRLLANEVAKTLVEAENAFKATPDSRDKTIALYKALMASGRVGEALELVAKWSQRDALDPEALIARADLAAMNGDRERALRILSGLADVRPGDRAVQKRLTAAFNQMGASNLSCQHRLALADIDPTDTTAVASAVRCAQDEGFANLAQSVLSSAPTKSREKIENTVRTLKLSDPPALSGDLRITATWNAPVDLDIALVDKNGKRLSWIGSTLQNVSVSAKDATSTSSETLAVLGLASGNMMLEVVRAKTDRSNVPVTGELTLTLPGGEVRKVPFVLTNQRLELGSVRVFFTSRLVPITGGGGGWR